MPRRKAPPVAAQLERLLAGKARKPPLNGRLGNLTQGVLTVMLDRIEAAIWSGVIDLLPDNQPADCVSISNGELAVLLATLFPEEFPELHPPAVPVRSAPGTDARLADYKARADEGLALYHPKDACPVRGDVDGRLVAAGKLALAIVPRANGTAPKVSGWASEVPPEPEEIEDSPGPKPKPARARAKPAPKPAEPTTEPARPTEPAEVTEPATATAPAEPPKPTKSRRTLLDRLKALWLRTPAAIRRKFREWLDREG